MFLLRLSSHASTLLLTGFLLLTFYTYGSLYFYRDPGSVFFDQSRAFERRYSNQRKEEAAVFRDEALRSLKDNKKTSKPWKAGSAPSICGVVITVARGEAREHPLEVSVCIRVESRVNFQIV
jgi:hypothetical protein